MQTSSNLWPARRLAAKFALLLLMLGAFWPMLASAQHTSALCPQQTASVLAGGSVTIDITSCATSIAFAGIGDVDGGSYGSPDFEDHGNATLRITAGRWYLDYSHNGSTGIGSTDVFEFSDASATGAGDVRVVITIQPAVSPITVLPGELPVLTAGTPFSQSLSASGGQAPYTYTLHSGVLPPGVSLTSNGVISGTPTQRGAYSFSVRATDSSSPTPLYVDKGYTGSVQNPSLAISPATATAIQGVPFSLILPITGGVAPHSCQMQSGALPAGISLSSTCELSGTTNDTPGNYPVVIGVTDSSTGPGTYFELENFSLTVSPAPSVSIAVSPAAVDEDGTTNLVFTVTRSLNLTSPTVVNLATTGTATPGTDYTGNVASVTILAGSTTATVTIDPTADGIVEADESVTLTIVAGTGYSIGSPASATGTIRNDDELTIAPATLHDGVAGASYDGALTASGGTAPYTFAVTAGSLPAGLTLSTDGVLSGTPTAVASLSFTVTATDGNGHSGSRDYTLTIAPPILGMTPADNSTLAGMVGVPFSQALAVTGGSGNYTYSLASGTLPAGLTLSGNSISGTPTTPGTSSFTITATDTGLTGTGAPFSITQSYQLVVETNVKVDPATLPAPAAGAAYSQTLTASGGTGPYTFAVTAGSLPAGLGLSSGGVLSGTVTEVGSFTFTVTATDGNGDTGERTYMLVVAAPTLSLSPSGFEYFPYGEPLTVTFTASGGSGSYSYVVDGILPPGMTLNGNILSGTPTGPGQYYFDVIATDTVLTGAGAPFTVASYYGFAILPASITVDPATLPAPVAGAAYSQVLTASGGVGSYTFAITAGSLPAGLGLSTDGVLSGMPTAAGTFNFRVTATDSNGQAGSNIYTLDVAAPTLTLSPPGGGLRQVPYGVPYLLTLAASGGSGDYSYAIDVGTLPAGLALNGDTISGTPTLPGTYAVAITATDNQLTGAGAPFTITQNYNFEVGAPSITIDPATLPAPVAGTAYSQALTASGGAGPYSFTVTAGSLPAGLTLSTDGVLSGTPTTVGTFSFQLTATDSYALTGSRAYSLVVAAPTLAMTPADNSTLAANVGVPFSQAFTATGGSGNYSYAITGGNLPDGLVLSGDTVAGTPTTPGDYAVAITATDNLLTGAGAPFSVTHSYTFAVVAPVIAIDPVTLPAPMAGAAYSQTLVADGGTGPYSFAVTAGSLPAGLGLSSGGVLSGTVTQVGSFNVTITATDSNGQTGDRDYALDVAAPVLTLTPAAGGVDVPYGAPFTQTLAASGGSGNFSYAISSGTLPAGLALSGDTISGTATVPGTYAVSVTATDAVLTGAGAPFTVTHAYSFTVAAPDIVVDPATLPAPVIGATYSQAFTASGGAGPYTFATTGTLPTGLSFSDDATLSGTPTAAGTFTFTVTATDANGQGGSRAYTLAVAAPALALTPATLPAGTAGVAYSQAFTSSGGLAPYRYEVSAGELPEGLSLTQEGVLAGTPTVAGSFGFSVTVTDSTGGTPGTATVAYTLELSPPTITVNPETLPDTMAGMAYTREFSAEGGTAPYTFAVTEGTLPDGVTLDAGGRLDGTPTAGGAFNFTVTATDALGFTGSRDYAITVIERPDPSQDPEVLGLIEAQVDAARRFSNTQISNFHQRMERLHGAGAKSFENGLGVSYREHCPQRTGDIPGSRCDRQAAGNGFAGGPDPADVLQARQRDDGTKSFGMWSAGMIRSGNHDGRNGSAGVDFETDGVTFGVDYRINRAFVLGGGVGYGVDAGDVGDNGSRSKSRAYTFALYGSYSPGERVFLDGLWGYQKLDYNLRRFVTANDSFVYGDRGGSQWFGSLALGADVEAGDWQFTPYARIDVTRGALDAYTERGDDMFALDYGDMDVDTTTGNAGVRMDYRRTQPWGVFSPQFRLEYQHDFKDSGVQSMRYADLPGGPVYHAAYAGFDRSRLMIGVGMLFDMRNRWSFKVDYRGLLGSGDDRDHGLMLNIERAY